MGRNLAFCYPRPGLPAKAGLAHRRAGPRPVIRLGLHLCRLPAAQEAMLDAEQQQNALFDKKLAREEQWIRKGIEARRTRNEGRVRALKRLREIRRERRAQLARCACRFRRNAVRVAW